METPAPQPSTWQRSTTRRFFCWLFSWRTLRRGLVALACVATLVALFYAVEDWRGKRAWEKFKRECEAKGFSFDRASVIPPPVPADQNFALTPIVASSYAQHLDENARKLHPWNTNVVNRLRMPRVLSGDKEPDGIGNWQKSIPSNLKPWQQYYRALAEKTNAFPVPAQPQTPAADVMLALSKYDPAIEELRQASRLPYSRFPLEYDKENPAALSMSHLATLKECALALQLRAIAELQTGQSDKALEDVKLMLRLADSIRTEPILASHLVRIAILRLALQPIWEGLAEHRWSDAQLAELDRNLAGLDFVADYRLAIRGEVVLLQGLFDYLRRHPEELPYWCQPEDAPRSGLGRFLFRLIPSGWFYQNQLRYSRAGAEFYLPLADVNRGIISPAANRRAEVALKADIKRPSLYNLFERMLLPAPGRLVTRFANAQAYVALARVAIALERYRLAHGEYPETLDALVPQFIAKLPRDVINGQPLKYRRTNDGRFVLYSVGWNETDDGGSVAVTKNGHVDWENGDWVWQYPAK